jgi:hypothetical protein
VRSSQYNDLGWRLRYLLGWRSFSLNRRWLTRPESDRQAGLRQAVPMQAPTFLHMGVPRGNLRPADSKRHARTRWMRGEEPCRSRKSGSAGSIAGRHGRDPKKTQRDDHGNPEGTPNHGTIPKSLICLGTSTVQRY